MIPVAIVALATPPSTGFQGTPDEGLVRSETTFPLTELERALPCEQFEGDQKRLGPGLPKTVQPNSHAARPNRHWTLMSEVPLHKQNSLRSTHRPDGQIERDELLARNFRVDIQAG